MRLIKWLISSLLLLLTPLLSYNQICDKTWLKSTSIASGVKIGELDISGQTITIEAKINRTAPYSGGLLYAGNLVSKHLDPTTTNYLLRPNTAEITTTNGYFRTRDICEIELNKTYHVALVYNGTNLKFFRNGFLMSEVAASGDLVLNNWPAMIGDLGWKPGHNVETFIGFIDEVRIWNIARSQAELKNFMNTTLPNPTTQVGLLAYYTLNSLKNKQGNATFDGSLVGNSSVSNDNPACSSFVADSCAKNICSVNPDFNYQPDICDSALIHFTNQTINATNEAWYASDGTSSVNSNPTLRFSKTGIYMVKLIVENGSGCIDSIEKAISITVKQKITTISNDTTICSGSTVQLKATSPGYNVYKWTPSLTLNNDKISNPVATPSRSTTYYVIVTNNNNCTSRDSVKVTVLAKPTVKSARDTTICNGSSVVLQPQITHASVINWSPAIGLNKTNVANPTASPSSNTTYTITAANGVCIAAEKIIVSVMPLPVTTVTNDTSICNNIPLQLQATGGEKYVWQPADYLSDVTIANPVALPPKNITYQVKVTGANGCERLDSVAIAIKPLPVLSVNPTSASICSGDTITISASGGDTYLWSPAATVAQPTSANSAVFPKNNTTYSILVSENICNTVDTVYTSVTVNPAITVSVTKSNDIDCNIGESRLNATGGTAYKWYPQTGLSDPNVSNPIATPSQTTQYHVKVFNGNGCEKEDSVEVKVLGESGQASYLMPTAFTPNNDGLNDYFGVKKWGNISNFELNVYDRWGKLIFFTRNSSNDWDGTYRGQLQPTGTYVYQVKAKTLCGTIYKKGTVTLIK